MYKYRYFFLSRFDVIDLDLYGLVLVFFDSVV